MSRRDRSGTQASQLTGIDQLFGRDLRRDGWFVDEDLVALGRMGPSFRSDERPSENSPDPAVIWALRNRRRG